MKLSVLGPDPGASQGEEERFWKEERKKKSKNVTKKYGSTIFYKTLIFLVVYLPMLNLIS